MENVFGFIESDDQGIMKTYTKLKNDNKVRDKSKNNFVGVFMVPNSDSALLSQDMNNILKTSKVDLDTFERMYDRYVNQNQSN